VKNIIERLSLLTLALLLVSTVAFAQGTTPDLSGTYEATVKKPDGSEGKLSLELKNEGGKITGRAVHGDKAMAMTDAKFENGTLTLEFGKDHKFVGKLDGDKLVGEATEGTVKVPLTFKKLVPAATSPAASSAPAAAAAVDLNGNWDAVADANGQPFPFALTLKVDGETVTGNSSSQLGDSTVKSGTWKDGKLLLQLESQNGVVTLSASVIEGKLSGEFDYAGQMQGRWVAVKKN
jgi:hypothetical protein